MTFKAKILFQIVPLATNSAHNNDLQSHASYCLCRHEKNIILYLIILKRLELYFIFLKLSRFIYRWHTYTVSALPDQIITFENV